MDASLNNFGSFELGIHSTNVTLKVQEAILEKVKALPFPPVFVSLITWGCLMLVLFGVIKAFKKCCVRKGKLKKPRKNKTTDPVNQFGKSLQEILDELESKERNKDEGDNKFGRLSFTCYYNFQKEKLKVDINQADDLLPVRANSSAHPYAVVYFLPKRRPKFQTCTYKNSIKPYWEETFTFDNFPYLVLLEQTIVFEIYDDNKFGRDSPLGTVLVPMRSIDVKTEKPIWIDISPPQIDKHKANVGDISVSLQYIPTANKLNVKIIELKNLLRMDVGALADPFVKIKLSHEKKSLGKKKSSIKKQTLNPYFDEEFEFNLPGKLLEKVNLYISVNDKDKVRSEIIGFINIGCSCSESGLTHWLEMLEYPRKMVTRWHALKPKNH